MDFSKIDVLSEAKFTGDDQLIVTKIFNGQEMIALIREALAAKGYTIGDVELQWKSASTYNGVEFCRAKVEIDI